MAHLFENDQGRRPADLAKMDGLSFKDSKAYPHPVEMARWRDAGFYALDLERGCFRLTPAGRAAVEA